MGGHRQLYGFRVWALPVRNTNEEAVYRADIDKISGWRLHLQYENGQVHLKDVIEGQRHDEVLGQIEAKKIRYERRKTEGRK